MVRQSENGVLRITSQRILSIIHVRKLREMVIKSVQDPAAREEAIPSGPAFVKIPDTVVSSSQGVALRIQKGSTLIEVSNDASERLCSLIKEVLPYVE